MSEYTHETSAELDVEVELGHWVKYVPAVLYGDYPQPEEGGHFEDITVWLLIPGANADGRIELTGGALYDELVDEAQTAARDTDEDEGDRLYDEMKDRKMEEDWEKNNGG